MKRILLKISWEAFSGKQGLLDIWAAEKLWEMISELKKWGYQIAIVVWGGNIYRGSKLIAWWLSAADSHSMSMLSTVFNAVTLKNILEKQNISSYVLDALWVEFLERYTSSLWKKYLSEEAIVICSSGTGNPYFSTDTAGVLRALELDCEACIKLTKVDGVYSADPTTYPEAEYFPDITCDDFLSQKLWVFDHTGIILARENHLPLFIAKLWDREVLSDILSSQKRTSKYSSITS